MRAFLARVLGLQRPPAPRLGALVSRMDDLEAELEGLRMAFRKLRGQLTGGLRSRASQNVEDAPPEANGEQPDTPRLSERVAALARARRGF